MRASPAPGTNRELALILYAIVHQVDTEDDPAGLVLAYADAVPSGTYVAITP
jgi:hypothetical protein